MTLGGLPSLSGGWPSFVEGGGPCGMAHSASARRLLASAMRRLDVRNEWPSSALKTFNTTKLSPLAGGTYGGGGSPPAPARISATLYQFPSDLRMKRRPLIRKVSGNGGSTADRFRRKWACNSSGSNRTRMGESLVMSHDGLPNLTADLVRATETRLCPQLALAAKGPKHKPMPGL